MDTHQLLQFLRHRFVTGASDWLSGNHDSKQNDKETLGYTNKEQASLKITYNNLDEYVAGLRRAITTPSQNFKSIGVKEAGEYRQLNSNILQIENEDTQIRTFK